MISIHLFELVTILDDPYSQHASPTDLPFFFFTYYLFLIILLLTAFFVLGSP